MGFQFFGVFFKILLKIPNIRFMDFIGLRDLIKLAFKSPFYLVHILLVLLAHLQFFFNQLDSMERQAFVDC